MRNNLPPPAADITVLPMRYRSAARPIYELVNRYPQAVTYPLPLTDAEVGTYLEVLSTALHRSFTWLDIARSCPPPDRPAIPQADWLKVVNEIGHGPGGLGFGTLRDKLCASHHATALDPPEDLLDRADYFFHVLEHRKDQVGFGPSYGYGICQVLTAWMASPHPLLAAAMPLLLKAPPLGINPRDPKGYVVFSR